MYLNLPYGLWWLDVFSLDGWVNGPHMPLTNVNHFFNLSTSKIKSKWNSKISLPYELNVGLVDLLWLWLSLTLTFCWNFMWWAPHCLPHHPWSSAWLPCQNLTYFDFGKIYKFFQLFIFLNFFFIFATVTWKIAFWGTLSHFLTPKVGSRRMLGLWGWISSGHTP